MEAVEAEEFCTLPVLATTDAVRLEETGTEGDRLYYDGKWYECKSCHTWDHTILAHTEAEFVEISPGSEGIGPPEVEVPK